MSRFFFKRGMAQPQDDTAERLRARVRALLMLGDNDAVSVTEIACAHPDCGDGETVILLMRAGERTRAIKVLKAMRLIDDADLAAALAGEGAS